LDKAVLCDMPTLEERKDVRENRELLYLRPIAHPQAQILRALSRKVELGDSVDLHELAAETADFSGADLQALLYNAHLDVVHEAIAAAETNGDSAHLRRRDEADEMPVNFLVIGGKADSAIRSHAEEVLLRKRVRACTSRPRLAQLSSPRFRL
jgi:peroxin-1